MYRINPLGRNVLIIVDEVIKQGPTNHTLDPRSIEQAIIIAEERFLRHTLSYDYYEGLVAEKNKLVTSSNIVTLQAEIDASLPVGAQPVTLVEGDIVNAAEYLGTHNKNLWNMFLWKLAAEVVIFCALPDNFIHFTSEGIVHKVPPAGPFNQTGVASPELQSVKWLIDKKLKDRIDPLRESMHAWICTQKKTDKTLYPLYKNDCGCDINGVAYQRKSDIVLGIYDEEENCDCWP